MTEHNILINRAPVLTLWATIVAERLGFDQDEALSLGKAVAGLTAQSKPQNRMSYYEPCGKWGHVKFGDSLVVNECVRVR